MNWKKIVAKTIEYIFYGITLVQVAFGLVWAFNQFPHMQNWQESYEYLDISRTWIMDEYVSFLYPLLLKLCTGIESVIGIPFYVPVYVIQLAAVILASWLFIRKTLKLEKSRALWAVGYLTSFPILLQFHMSVRTQSLEVSGILMLITFFETNLIGAAIMTLLLIWLNPDMALIVAAAWLVYLIGELIKARKEKKASGIAIDWKGLLVKCVAFVMALVVGLSVNGLVQTPGSRGRIQKTFWAAAFQRVVTEYFSKSYAIWNEEVRSTYTIEEAMEMAKRSDNMMYVVGPALEADWGRERANELYKQMTVDCLRVRTRDIVYQIRDDLVDSILMPFSILWQDNGERLSQTGWNYGRMRENVPGVTMYYLKFSVYALLVSLVCGLTFLVTRKKVVKHYTYMLVAALVQCIQNVLNTGNRVNYGMQLLVVVWWCGIAILCTMQESTKAVGLNKYIETEL